MSGFEDLEHLAGKIEWEGGMEMALDYGIKTEDMPDGYPELTEKWAEMQAKWEDYCEARDEVEKLLPELD